MKKKIINKNKPIIRLLYILDESGSMEDIKPAVISGFNEYVGSLKEKGNFKMTLVKFDSRGIRTPYEGLDIKRVPKLNADTYSPGQMTPLYDSVVEAVERLATEMTDNQPALVCVMTDGLENASTKHNEQCLRDLINKLQAKGNYTFVFMGANQDSWATAGRWGIPTGNIANWQATTGGTANVFNMVATSTTSFADSATGSTANFFAGGKK